MTEINAARTGLEDVEEALKDVIDPELGVNIVDLGLLYGLKYSDDDGALLIDMTLTTAACPLTDVIEEQVGKALDGVVDEWRLNWVWMPPWGPERITEDGTRPDAGPRLQHLDHRLVRRGRSPSQRRWPAVVVPHRLLRNRPLRVITALRSSRWG